MVEFGGAGAPARDVRRVVYKFLISGVVIGAAAAVACTTFNGSTAGTESAPVASFLTMARAGQLCSLVQQCVALDQSMQISSGVPVTQGNFSACMDALAGPLPPTLSGNATRTQALSCAGRATSCAGAGGCFAFENLASDDPRCQGVTTQDQVCDTTGENIVDCKLRQINHCTAPFYATSSRCDPHYSGGGRNLAFCVTDGTCPGASCNGDSVSQCFQYTGGDGGAAYSLDCASFGETCGPVNGSNVGCVVDGQEQGCSGTPNCNGETLRVCTVFGLSPFDCSTMNATCAVDGAGAHCIPSDHQCLPTDPDVNVCTGDKIALCIGGQKTSFDCTTIPGGTCVAGGSGSLGSCQVPLGT